MNQMHILMVICALLMVSTYQNCSTASPEVTKATNDPFDTGGPAMPLSAAVGRNEVPVGEATMISISGGVSPYLVSVTSGSGTVTQSGETEWAFDAGNTTGTVSIKITDADSDETTAFITVIDGTGTPGGTPPPVACAGGTYTDAQTCNAEGSCTVTVNFASKVPASCKITQLKVTSNYYNCGVSNTFTFGDSGTQQFNGSPNPAKYAGIQADANFTTNSVRLTSVTYGFGSGNPACISGISYQLTLSSN